MHETTTPEAIKRSMWRTLMFAIALILVLLFVNYRYGYLFNKLVGGSNNQNVQAPTAFVYSTPVATEIVPADYSNLGKLMTQVGDSYTTDSGWIITVKEFDADSVLLNAYYSNASAPLVLKYDDGAWSGGDGTVRLVARNTAENGHYVEVWTHK